MRFLSLTNHHKWVLRTAVSRGRRVSLFFSMEGVVGWGGWVFSFSYLVFLNGSSDFLDWDTSKLFQPDFVAPHCSTGLSFPCREGRVPTSTQRR